MSRHHTILESEREIAVIADKPRVRLVTVTTPVRTQMSIEEVLAIVAQAIEDRASGIAITIHGVTITITKEA